MALENRLKEYRARLGINQADMGKLAGVSRQTISLIERGDYSPSVTLNIINLRLDITHLYYPAKNSFQKGRLKRREIFTELLLYTLTT